MPATPKSDEGGSHSQQSPTSVSRSQTPEERPVDRGGKCIPPFPFSSACADLSGSCAPRVTGARIAYPREPSITPQPNFLQSFAPSPTHSSIATSTNSSDGCRWQLHATITPHRRCFSPHRRRHSSGHFVSIETVERHELVKKRPFFHFSARLASLTTNTPNEGCRACAPRPRENGSRTASANGFAGRSLMERGWYGQTFEIHHKLE